MKLGICIPYRNRKKNLKILLEKLGEYLNSKKITHQFYISHQVDKKLFNRGAMKNIAAKHAFEDGCDYIAWHDVDMIPADDTPDYSYPKDYPTHIATNLSKFNDGMRYEQYFGGVVLFTKEQVEKINGYSNEYWDWGQEDDDLFWRCYYENLVKTEKLISYKNIKVAKFDGNKSYIEIQSDRNFLNLLKNTHTISILLNAEHNIIKHPPYLIGDSNKKFIEYPILRKSKENNWGLSFNNSNALSFMCKDVKNNFYYNWGKKQSNIWTWLTVSYDSEKNIIYFLINDELIYMENDIKINDGVVISSKLKSLSPAKYFYLGYDDISKIFFKGKIAAVRIYDELYFNVNSLQPKYYWNIMNKKKFGNLKIKNNFVQSSIENIDVIKNILPYRRFGKFFCLPHKDQGFKDGEWIKKRTTAKNEKKLMKKLLNKNFEYKTDGINSLQYKIISIKKLTKCAQMIDVKLN